MKRDYMSQNDTDERIARVWRASDAETRRAVRLREKRRALARDDARREKHARANGFTNVSEMETRAPRARDVSQSWLS